MRTPSTTAIPGVQVSGYTGRQPAAGHGRSDTVIATLLLWLDRAKQRRQLSQLDDRLLSDIGVDRFAADEESRKPFWRI